METTAIVIGSPVQQKPAVLAPVLDALAAQASAALRLSYVFIDDNHEPASSELLRDFARSVPDVTVVEVERAERYECDDSTHHWKESLIWRVAAFKDAIIEHTLEVGADHLFLIDSDIVLRPGTVEHLANLQKDVVSEVFWTAWDPGGPALPQVWLRDVYDMVHRNRGEQLTDLEAKRRVVSFLEVLHEPGTYEVGGLGACTLISRRALEAGARFAAIPNLSFWGEDRHFCVRASALGLRLHADTHVPPLHLYRPSALQELPAWLAAVSPPRSGDGSARVP